jgi:hypothetical protein
MKSFRMPARSDFDEVLNQPAGSPVQGAQALNPRAQAFRQAQMQAKAFRQAQQQAQEQNGQ